MAGLLLGAIFFAYSSKYPERLAQAASALRRSARHRVLWVVVFALLGPLMRLALLPLAPIPFPSVHDEFVHLLAADTLMHGRVTNPPHPFSEFFETIYVLQKPGYSASYPLGTGAFLAAGWKLTGHPWFGVWLAMVVCCCAVAWMQYRWLPPLAAWIGGLLCSLSLGVSSFWMNSYFGGAVTAAGGALVIGALPTLERTGRIRSACILGLGWTLVWFTRPYESLILGLVVGVAIFLGFWRRPANPARRRLITATLVLAGFVALDFAGFCYHNWRVTGRPLFDPYRLTQRLYGVPHAFLWQPEVPEPPHLTAQQERIYLYQRDHFRTARSLTRCWPLLGSEAGKIWAFYAGYPLTIPLAIGLFAGSRKMHALRLILAAAIAWSLLYPRLLPNYLSAMTGVFFALASYGLVCLSRWRPRARPWGPALAVGLCIACIAAGARVLYPWYLFGGCRQSPGFIWCLFAMDRITSSTMSGFTTAPISTARRWYGRTILERIATGS